MQTRSFVVLGCFAWVIACVGDGPAVQNDAGNDAGTTPDAPSIDTGVDAFTSATLTITPAAPFIRRNGTLDVTVNVDRQSVTGAIPFTVSGLPNGISGSIAPVAVNSTTTKLSLSASATATEGEATVKLTSPGVADFTFTLLVGDASGSLDSSFGGSGIVLEPSLANAYFFGLTLQSDGSLVAVGSGALAGGTWIARRYGKDGTSDTAFDTAASAVMPTSGGARAVAIDPASNDVIVVGGAGSTEEMTAVRLLPTGAPDLGFASAGVMSATIVDFGSGSRAYAVHVQPDSTLLLGGTLLGQSQQGLVEHYDTKGTRDTQNWVSFRTPDPGSVRAIWLLNNGDFMVAGTNKTASASPPTQFMAARLLPNGQGDSLFGTGGVRTFTAGASGNGAALTTSEDVLVVGQNVMGPAFCQSRITQKAQILFEQTNGGGNIENYQAAASAGNDETYTTGFGGGTYDKYATLIMNKADGSLDTAFGTNGTATFEDPNTPDQYSFQFYAMLVQPDGRIIVAGRRNGQTPGPIIMRIWP